jgi:hypothetical protein
MEVLGGRKPSDLSLVPHYSLPSYWSAREDGLETLTWQCMTSPDFVPHNSLLAGLLAGGGAGVFELIPLDWPGSLRMDWRLTPPSA